MSLGKRGPNERQEPIWIEAASLATPVGHPFYEHLNRLLDKRGFDAFAENACLSFYAKVGRPGLAPGWREISSVHHADPAAEGC
jgi:hypothetical protein